jgi:hypothetical protein
MNVPIRPTNNPAVPSLRETWQQRAKECRATAKRLRSFEARKRMLTAAEDFDRMAFNAGADQPAEPDQWSKITL